MRVADPHSLQQRLDQILPGSRLRRTPLGDCGAIELYLLDPDFPRERLSSETVRRVMDTPLYWVFCWASGRVLASYILRHPQWVAGARVLDFGCGSGIVAIAAKMAGAAHVVACDNDPDALAATRLNARLNRVSLELADDFHAVRGDLDLIVVADVLYDRANLPWLDRLARRASRVLVADSRVKDFDVPPYREIGRFASNTEPDLDESPEFRYVRLYLAGEAAE